MVQSQPDRPASFPASASLFSPHCSPHCPIQLWLSQKKDPAATPRRASVKLPANDYNVPCQWKDLLSFSHIFLSPATSTAPVQELPASSATDPGELLTRCPPG